jgi:hypothetical protein
MTYTSTTHLVHCIRIGFHIRRQHLGVCTMFRSAAICVAFVATAIGTSARSEESTSLWIGELAAHDRVEIRTAKYVLRLTIVDPATGEAQASFSKDGVVFGQVSRVFVLGATKGRHPEGLMLVRMGRLEVGMGIELAIHTMDAENRRITAPVQALHVSKARTLKSA